jgi:hypothetical protein
LSFFFNKTMIKAEQDLPGTEGGRGERLGEGGRGQGREMTCFFKIAEINFFPVPWGRNPKSSCQ